MKTPRQPVKPDDDPHLAEADALSMLPVDYQREILKLHRATSRDPKVSTRQRQAARAKADALQRLLGLSSPR